MIRICICDDNKQELEKIYTYAEDFGKKTLQSSVKIRKFSSVYDLLDYMESREGFDIYLLDILMPHMSGMELARKIRERKEICEIIFLTISREYAVDAFSVKASNYLLKPIKQEDFETALREAAERLKPRENPSVILKVKGGLRKVCLGEILFVESDGHYCEVNLVSGEIVVTKRTLTSFYEEVKNEKNFFSPHRAYIINLEYVNGISPSSVALTNGKEIPVSRNIYPALKKYYLENMF